MFTKTKEPMVNKSNQVQAGIVYQTDDLDKFVALNGNRTLNELHVKRLADSITNNGMLMNPILVNALNEVIDGQHRLEAARLAESGIYYIVAVDYGLSEVQALNLNQKNWSRKDFLNGYADLGITPYIKLKQFMKLNPDYSITLCISLCQQMDASGYEQIDFNSGQWRGGDFKIAQKWANNIRKVSEFYDGYNRRTFVMCMVGMLKKKQFNFNEFIHKLSLQPLAIFGCATQEQCKTMIEDIYNYRRREKVNLRF